MLKPSEVEYAPFYKGYIDSVTGDVRDCLENQPDEMSQLVTRIPEDKLGFAYDEGKWTIREVLGHIVDTERIMSTRLLRFCRGDRTTLPGFDEKHYVANGHFKNRPVASLLNEFTFLRKSNLLLIDPLSEEVLKLSGEANGSPCSVRALVFILAGHLQHHLTILEKRYLSLLEL